MEEYPVNDERDVLPKETPRQPNELPIRGIDLVFLLLTAAAGMLLCNVFFAGLLNLGFAIAHGLFILVMTVWLLVGGKKPTVYSLSLLALCVWISAGFARSDDGFVKFVMCVFLFVAVPLGLALLSGHNLRDPGDPRTLLDGMGVFFRFGFGKIGTAVRSVKAYVTGSGKKGNNVMSVLLGAVIALPVLLIVVSLLMSADAAFEGLMNLLPSLEPEDILTTGIYGLGVGILWFSLGVSLLHAPKRAVYPAAEKKGVAVLTVNTVLFLVCGVYLIYLLSQTAYFVGGFAGILPEEYTMAQYARRGFFEMAWICAINLLIIAVAVGLVEKKDQVPLFTRLLCLFIGIVTVFLVATASGKMFLYIGAYGLTRLRVLTQVVMVFLAFSVVMVCLWLFVPKLRYMKTLVLAALILGGGVLWTDVDTVVARYNVDAYLSGKLETVDVQYLSTLGNGAVPHIARLAEEGGSETAAYARAELYKIRGSASEDFRDWNYVNEQAVKYRLEPEKEAEPSPEGAMPADKIRDAFLRNVQLEAIHISRDHVCIRGWEWGSDAEVYCIALLDGTMYTPVYDKQSWDALHSSEQLTADGHDNWLPIIETEFVTDGSHTGIRGRSIEQDVTLWYLLDIENGLTFGPFYSEDEYWQACYDQKVYPMGIWKNLEG